MKPAFLVLRVGFSYCSLLFPSTLASPLVLALVRCPFFSLPFLFFPPFLPPAPEPHDCLGAVYQLDWCTYNLLYRLRDTSRLILRLIASLNLTRCLASPWSWI